jgi:hypothetical protein
MTKKYKMAGDGAAAESTHLPALGIKVEGFVGINRYLPVMDPQVARDHFRAVLALPGQQLGFMRFWQG